MPISVYYKNDGAQVCTLRPSPLVSIASNLNKVGGENVGVTYSITLTGTILEDRGTPYAVKMQDNTAFKYYDGTSPTGIGPYGQFDNTGGHSENNRPKIQPIPENSKLDAIFSKQRALKSLFAIDGQRLEIMPVHGDEPAVVCYPRVVSIDFQEGLYINKCDYSITLEADTLLNKNLTIDDDGNPLPADSKVAISGANDGHTTQQVIALSGAFIESFSESWNIEVDDERAENLSIPRSYRITHSVSAQGKTHHFPSGGGVHKIAAWQNAKNYVVNTLLAKSGILDYPNTSPLPYPSVNNQLGSGTINLVDTYRGFNHTRTEDIDVAGGSFSVSETFLLASGDSYEDYNMSVSKGIDTAFVSVSIDGTVTGLNEVSPSGYGAQDAKPSGAYDNALKRYHEISKSGQFGLTCDVFRRAQNSVAFELNSQPKSVSLGLNEFNGEITYSLEFDNRPTNILSGVLSENISVNDTYPGDVFSVVPVIGRATGPVLQYVGSRTEYKRDVQIELQMDYTDLHYAHGRGLVTQKPSIVEPTRTQLRELIKSLSPESEPGVRKYFINAPNESWSPKTGSYSFSISWTYELDR
jgi:hypothetical protein